MREDLPRELDGALAPLWEALPPERALTELVVVHPHAGLAQVVEVVRKHPVVQGHARRDELLAGLWLYADELDTSHRLSQAHEDDATFNYWHAIMHRREGDFSNSKYWFRRVGPHPVLGRVNPGYRPDEFVDAVERAHDGAAPPPAGLVALQRREWWALFTWCAADGGNG